MSLWTAAEAAEATGAEARGDWTATGLSIDTRTIEPGDLFVALTDMRDGHDFVADALSKGAAAALVSRVPEGVAQDAPLLLAGDVMDALRALGAAGRARSRARVIGVTGSVGKTSTKEMLRAILAGQGNVHAAEKSYNNHWGVPLTLARMPADADFAVIEIGMSNPGEIAPLAALARPHVALVTTVAPAHLAAFGRIEGIAEEKAAIFGGLEPGGVAIVNADLDTTPILVEAARSAGARLSTFGRTAGADWHLGSAEIAGGVTVVQGAGQGEPLVFRLRTAGAHFAMNGLSALAAAAAAGADTAIALGDLGNWTPYEGRGARERVQLDPRAEPGLGFDLIDDSYNANPASVSAALGTLAALTPQDGQGRVGRGRRIAILGDMLELGSGERQLHAALAEDPSMARVDLVHVVGPRMAALHEVLPEEQQGMAVDAAADLATEVRALVDAGDIVLVKGSLGVGLARVVDAIRNIGHSRAADETDEI
ncbi:UDP-N-acetylmuramoyl-tripeptide--D-alanyl-D-alanine ligase [Roseicyclus sp. F158]|uniref:UDP-N-acetylmuramoyl-tripeptide--D-alanyl-D-alanine ligase n=1 Tax=Tropicimonas omnivorans TaxID=3075590 RepID=A0ABU3DI52_9RHOB|nr:UDP-N-acetylmuramoyl-tripeptide--D-alanyl-D-alanine ligase [Roseicyclus sp. F158]MDT0683361.1 UDP-N-acetylmuramoyl-tripeptide--D-alanyl-D-alanine ligase [Roseicyclus sp. F158]